MKDRAATQDQSGSLRPSGSAQPTTETKAALSLRTAVVMLLLLAAAAPFLSLAGNFVGGLITLSIIFIGFAARLADDGAHGTPCCGTL